MGKISIHIDDSLLEDFDRLVKTSPNLTKRNRSSLCNYLISQEVAKQKRDEMLEAAKALDELNLGWNEEEQSCAILDAEISG